MTLTPGLQFLFATGPKLVLPPLLVHSALRLVSTYAYSFHISSALVACVWLFSLPIYVYILASYTRFVHVREARSMGAELVPQLRGRLPGNVDLLWTNLFRKDQYIGDGFSEPMKTLGSTYAMTVLGDMRIITAHPQNIKAMLTTDFDKFEKGKKFSKFTGSVLGTGVFNSDGEMWQFHRKITRPFFARERITDFGIFDAKSRMALDKMQERLDRGIAIDFQDICSRFTIDSACEFLLGTSINSLDDPLPRPGQEDNYLESASNRFARAFADAQNSISIRSRLGVLWQLAELFKDRTRDDMKVVRDFIEPIVRAAIHKREGGQPLSPQDDSLLQHLLNVTDDWKLIVDETVNIMLAARDTTAGLLTFVAYCLAMHPEVLGRLREEIISTVGTSRTPTFDDVRGMKYLRAVINETLRLFPSVPLNGRNAATSTTMVNEKGEKFYVPANTRVTYSVMIMHRNESYWGQDAQVFDPDRWLDNRMQKLTSNPFIFLPFNAGPRICLGQQFAYHEASFFIIRLLQRFDSITLASEAQPPDSRPPASWKESTTGTPRKKIEKFVMKSHLTAYAMGGLWLRMDKAKVTEGV